MASVSIRELKNRLSEYLRMVRRGERALVTDREGAVTELCQPVNRPEAAANPERVRHIHSGRVRPGALNRANLYPRMPRAPSPGTARRLLDEERGERQTSTRSPAPLAASSDSTWCRLTEQMES